MFSISRARAGALAGTVAIAAAAVPFLASGASAASPVSSPAAGTIHLYVINTSLNPAAPNKVLITGAFSDHGAGKHGTFHLTRGTITSANARLKAIISSPSFGTAYQASCSFTGVATGRVPIVSGTGAYAGIHGTVTATVTEAVQGSLLKNGKCNESSNAPAVAQDLIVIGSGKVSF